MNDQGLVVSDISVSYGQHQALKDVSLTVKPGEVVVILGANGAGKSSLLKSIAGLVPRSSGSIELNGLVTTPFSAHSVVEAGIALVPEGRGIFGDLSVKDNLTLGAYSKRAREQESANLQQVYHLFPKLVERRNQIARTMSGGEQQMVAIGRAMMSAPSILMLDEPSLGLSPLLASEVFKTLKAVRETGLGILLVEQNAKQSLAIADRGYLLETGNIVAENTAQNLLNDDAVRNAYLGGASKSSRQKSSASSSLADKTKVALPTSSVKTVSAESFVSGSIADLVRQAEARQKEHLEAQRNNGA